MREARLGSDDRITRIDTGKCRVQLQWKSIFSPKDMMLYCTVQELSNGIARGCWFLVSVSELGHMSQPEKIVLLVAFVLISGWASDGSRGHCKRKRSTKGRINFAVSEELLTLAKDST